jgi:dTDP-4-dehydrorhamnose reductase
MQLLSGKLNRFPSDQISNPTLTENLAEATLEIATRKLAGIYNIVGEDRIDRYQFALSIASKFNLDTSTWRPVSTAELGQKAPRPLDCGLEIDKAKRELQTPLLTLEKALQFVYEKSQIQ